MSKTLISIVMVAAVAFAVLRMEPAKIWELYRESTPGSLGSRE